MSRKRILAAILASMVTLSALTGCGGGKKDDASSGGDGVSTVVFATSEADGKNWQPSVINNGAMTSVMLQFYETLIAWDSNGEMYPLLAESYEFTGDETTGYKLHVTLREGIKTSAGDPITASDVLWSYQWASEQAEYIKHTSWIDFDNTTVIDDLNIEFGITTMNYYILNDLSRVAVTAKKSFDESPDNCLSLPVGSGPYVMTSYTPDVEFVLEKNPDYWNKDTSRATQLQNVDRIVTKFVTEDSQRTIELESGNVDIIMSTPFTEIDRYEQEEQFQNFIWDSPETYCVYYNASKGALFDNELLRQAVSYGIDNKAVVQTLFNGVSHAAVSVVGPNQAAEWDEAYETRDSIYSYNPEKAKQLLKQAGYGEGELKVRLLTDNSQKFSTFAEVIQGQLIALGIDCEIKTVDASTFMTVVFDPDAYDLCVNGFAAKGSVLFYFNNQLNNKKNIRGFWDDAEFQEILARALVDANKEDVATLIEMFDEKVPTYPVFNKSKVYTYRTGIEDFKVYDDGYVYPGDLTYSADAEWLYD